MLRRKKFAVDEATNGDEAIDRLRVKKYDAVVLDLMMGPGSGFDVLHTMKEHRPGEKFVIVISATSERTMKQLDEENVFAKLRKPFDTDELLRAVGECCEH